MQSDMICHVFKLLGIGRISFRILLFEANFRNTKLQFLKSLRHESSKLLVINEHYEML